MKIFIWDDPYPVKYGSSLAFAVANDLAEARELLKVAHDGRWDHVEHGVDVDMIEPSRVMELPYAEKHEWSE